MMVVNADSISTSFTPAASVWPMGLVGSIWISKCRPLCFSNTAAGLAASPWKAMNWAAFFRPASLPFFRVTASWPFFTA
ncbi:hypothetical protein FQZ97_350140 [compost metagenome]